ncbi:hypothetical protein Tco_0309649 [Tanacetum coccineum]
MIRVRSEVEEAVRIISSTYSTDNVDIWWARNKYPPVIVDEGFIFVTHSLFPVRISKRMERKLGDKGRGGCYKVGGGGGGRVIGGVGVVCGNDVDSGVGGVVCGVVCGFVCGVVCGVVCGQGTDIRDDCKGTQER